MRRGILFLVLFFYSFYIGVNAQSTTLLQPVDGSQNVPITQTFSWNAVSGAIYNLQISTADNFSWSQINAANLSTASYQASGLYYYTTYYWRVGVNTGSGYVYTDAWSFNTGDGSGGGAPNPGPTLISPSNLATNVATNGTFSWNSISGATSYRIQISTSSYFGLNQIDQSSITSTSFNASGLYLLTDYYWRVMAVTSEGDTDWSTIRSFTTSVSDSSSAPIAPALSSPANNSTGIGVNPALSWSASSGASTYNLQVSTSNQFTSNIINQTGLTALTYNVTGLDNSTVYYWRVSATNSSGTSGWSAVWSFTTQIPVPQAPLLSLPADSANNIAVNPAITWYAATGAATYNLQISASSQFTTNIVNQTGLTNLTYNVTGLNYSTKYYWRVSGVNTTGSGEWSNVWSFTTKEPVPTLTIASPGDSILTNQSAVTVSGTVGSASNTIKINGNTVTNSNGSFSSSVALSSQGYNTIRIAVYNNSGDSTIAVRNVKYDSVPPVLTITNPANELITNISSLAVTGTVEDENGILSLKINQDSTITIENGSFSNNITLNPGSNTITITAKDNAGNITTVTRDVTLDTVLPVITINIPSGIAYTNQAQYVITGSIDENVSLLTINGDTTQVNENNFTKTITLAEGENSVVIITTDLAGNTANLQRIIKLDTQAPVLNVSAPADSFKTKLNQVLVAGSVTEAGLLVKVNNDSVLVDQTLNFSKTVSLTEGLNSLSVTAKDSANNITTVLRTIRLDSNPPVLAINAPANNLITKDTLLTVSGTVSDSTMVTLTVNQDTLQVTGGNYSKQISLIEGLNNITVKAVDEPGNETILTRSVRLDTKKPVFAALIPALNIETDIQAITLSGSIKDSTLVTLTINNDSVYVADNGNFSLPLSLNEGDNTFTFYAVDRAGNSTTINRIINYQPLVIPQDPALTAPKINDSYAKTLYDANSFLWEGSNAVQYNVTPGSIQPHRVGVVRGTVVTLNGEPLPGVKITSPNHPEWGVTYTRMDGNYDFGLSAGGYLTVKFERLGYRPAQRVFDSPWNSFVVIDTVALVKIDTASTPINFSQTFQVAQSSINTDSDGQRRSTIFFEQGTVTTIKLPDNSTLQLDSITARATEYSVGAFGPKALPADLPSSVSYTYCTDLTADEALSVKAKSVTFSKPVRLFTDNFIGFPVGTPVPTGIWNWDILGWLPRENGVVIKIISITESMADISISQNETIATAAQLDSLGITNEEREYIASTFNIGKVLWRTRLNEFGVINQGFANIQPSDAETPKVQRPERFVSEDKYSALSGTSTVDVLNQTMHKSIGVAGTPFSLTYSSDRVEGRESQLVIPLTGLSIQGSLRKIHLEITVLGVKTKKVFAPATNLSYTFIWDGKDEFGRSAPGRHKADILIGYEYASNFQQPAAGTTSFGSASGMAIPGIYSRETTTLWKCAQEVVGLIDNRAASLGGWNLNIHNGFDQVTNTLYLGSGQNQITEKLGPIVQNIAGNGVWGWSANNVIATNSPLRTPTNIAVAPDGTIYFVEKDANKIKKIDPNGILTTVAGTGYKDTQGDGGPAILAMLYEPGDLALDKEGNIYFLQTEFYATTHTRLRKIDKNGIINTVVGINGAGYSGDGGPASEAQIWKPTALEIGPDGCIYIADQNFVNSIPATPKFSPVRIRKIDNDGIITTIAGGVETIVSNPENYPATQIRIDAVADMKFGPDGDLYILCGQNPTPENPLRHIILKLGKDGRIHKITKGGFSASSFEYGKSADQTNIQHPVGLTFDRNCSICYSVDDANSTGFRIGIITPDYINNLLAGSTATQQPSGPAGMPAKLTAINIPNNIAAGPDGNIYYSETGGNLIRKITLVTTHNATDGYSINSTNGKELYFFNNSGKQIRTEDALTRKILYSFTYDSNGRLSTIKDVDSLVTTIERDTAGVPTAIISPRGERTNLAVDIDGYLTSVSNPNNETIGLGYVRAGLLSQITDPKNNSSLFGYDDEGRLISKQTPDEGELTYTKQKTVDGYKVTEAKPLGETITRRVYYQLTGDVKKEVTNSQGISININDLTTFADTLNLPDGNKTITQAGFDPRFGVEVPVAKKTTTKTPAGLTNVQEQLREVTSMEGPNVKAMKEDNIVNTNTFRTEYTYKIDGINNYVKSTSAEGRITQKYYDEKGRIIKEIIPGAGEVEYLYLQNKVTQKIHYPLNSGTERREYYFYDSKDRMTSSTDPLWRADSLTYNDAGRLTCYTFKDGRKAYFNYDSKGNLTSIVPPGKTAHVFEYDRADKKTTYIPPVVGTDTLNAMRYVYDQDGKLTSTIMPDSSQIQLVYDTDINGASTGRVKNIIFNGGTITYNYNTVSGQITQVSTSAGDALSYTYDGSLPKTETWSGNVNGSIGLTYNNDFRVIEQKINNANAVAFTYDKDGLMKQAGALKMNYSTSTGQIIADTLGSVISTYEYNNFGELYKYTAKYGANVLFGTEYTRDQLGRITTLAETNNGTTDTLNYTYDTAGRLTAVNKNGTLTAEYVYDTNGNRLAKIAGADTTRGNYDAQDRLSQYGNEYYTYNKNGFLTKKIANTDTTLYAYDNLGNLKQVKLPNGNLIDYVVDANNRRIAKKVNNVIVSKWIYSGELTPIAELDSAGNVAARFVYGTKSNIPDYVVKNGITYKIASDHLGSPRMIVNASTGAIIEKKNYNEFGIETLVSRDSLWSPLFFGYCGGIADNHTGLVRFGARDYDAFTGRWTAKDPIGFGGGDLSLYGYVVNDPINNVDKTGRYGDSYALSAGNNIVNSQILAGNALTGIMLAAVANTFVDMAKGLAHGNSMSSNKENMLYEIMYMRDGKMDTWKYGVTGRQPLYKRPGDQVEELGPGYSWRSVGYFENRAAALAAEYYMTMAYCLNNGEMPNGMKRPDALKDLASDYYK